MPAAAFLFARDHHDVLLTSNEEATPSLRNPILSYKRPQLVTRLSTAQQQLQEVQQQQTPGRGQAETGGKCPPM
jgi:hypothetical protein